MTTFAAVAQPIDRDRYGRPLVTPPGGGKPIAYTRCTTYVDCLEDKHNLNKWMQRMVILGLIERPDLALSAHAYKEDKRQLNLIAEDAMEAAKAHGAATIGTAIHALTEQIDRGHDIGAVPAAYAADIDAYRKATADLAMHHIEVFTVLDDLKIGGTFDRIVEYQGKRYIADLKTGSIDYAAGKIAMQLAVYSRSMLYDHTTKQRTPLDVDQDRAIVIHLPAGTGTASLHWANIAAGWEAVDIATQVRQWRSRKGLMTKLAEVEADPIEQAAAVLEQANMLPADPIADAINNAETVDQLGAAWTANHDKGWTDTHTAMAVARRNIIVGA